MKNTPTLKKLFTIFFKIGLFTFGGGFAMIPLIEKEIVDDQKWIEKNKFLDTISLTQTVPGAIAINLAIFLGYKMLGLAGAIVATLGVALPSFLIISLIAISFNQFKDNQIIQSAFQGIRPAVVALIAYASYKLAKNINWSGRIIGFFLIALIGRLLLGISPIIIILTSGIIGLLTHIITNRLQKKEAK